MNIDTIAVRGFVFARLGMSRAVDVIVRNKHGIRMGLIDQQVAVVFLVIIRAASSGFSAKWFQWMFQTGDEGMFMAGRERRRSSVLKLEET